MKNSKTYLVTGGCGFIGTNTVEYFLSKNIDVIVVDNLSRKGSTENLNYLRSKYKFRFYKIDITQSSVVDDLIKRTLPQVVIHLAGQVAMTTSIEKPLFDLKTNLLGSVNLLEATRKFNPNSIIIYSSTNKVYGDLNEYTYLEEEKRYSLGSNFTGFGESAKIDFHSPYGCSKGSADMYFRDYFRIYGINTIVFRHSSMYGPLQHSTFNQGWVGWFMGLTHDFLIGKVPFIEVAGNGKQVRDLLYSSDVVSAYEAAIEQYKDLAGKVFNIGGGIVNSMSILELNEYIKVMFKSEKKLIYRFNPPRLSDQKIFIADNSNFSRITKWAPKVNKEIGLKRMKEWMVSSGKIS
jgi:CDP-paratose 2-epimerase